MATFNLYDEIGSGGYGNVYKSARVIDGKAGEIIYAVKKLKKNLDLITCLITCLTHDNHNYN